MPDNMHDEEDEFITMPDGRVVNMALHCPWCGEDFEHKCAYDEHYAKCFIDNDPGHPSPAQVAELINNPNHY